CASSRCAIRRPWCAAGIPTVTSTSSPHPRPISMPPPSPPTKTPWRARSRRSTRAPTGRTSVPSRRALALLLLALPVAAKAQEQTASQFLASLYEPYKKKDFKGQPYWEADRFFAPDLAAAMNKDYAEAKKRKEVPTLDGDPFIDAQDWQVES